MPVVTKLQKSRIFRSDIVLLVSVPGLPCKVAVEPVQWRVMEMVKPGALLIVAYGEASLRHGDAFCGRPIKNRADIFRVSFPLDRGRNSRPANVFHDCPAVHVISPGDSFAANREIPVGAWRDLSGQARGRWQMRTESNHLPRFWRPMCYRNTSHPFFARRPVFLRAALPGPSRLRGRGSCGPRAEIFFDACLHCGFVLGRKLQKRLGNEEIVEPAPRTLDPVRLG